ncbi:MAG: NAD-dependent epimerase/dehydratase family protein [Candidatus Devosia phytovorans]|uniref:NAD-dependent epimerase/dehydratase family protein n=1 Tax=Candidatus Devosia phytovorans TaxID=3121372 RepID=A0AAJ6AYQ4_9HYPH|nr:NAD-dependent epimerase/dehydratase family protein [Devosia sp.]WEK02976.1 MAG: NAD-dependent epimerase/dehydratase family protein [Devosia sp.]
MSKQVVLVTGGSGFIAGHLIVQLLEKDYVVRATLRSLAREGAVRQVLVDAGAANLDELSFVAADLMQDAGWPEAVSGVDFVLHVASPVHAGHVENEDDVIRPAREGALRVLRAARDARVRRVVLTSAFHAVSWGHPHGDHVFTEADWSVLDGPGVDAYGRSKTLAERAAWDFIAREGGDTELTTMLPVAVMGPVMGKDISGANHVIERLLSGAMPAMPNIYFPIVDVRDVAAAHIAAMLHPEAAGERLLLSNGPALAMKAVAAILRQELGTDATRVPTRTIPDFVLRLMGLFNPQMRAIVPDLGYAKKTSNEKARHLLGWTPRDPRQAIVDAGRSMLDRALIKHS